MRHLFPILTALVMACTGQPSAPYSKCDDYEPCHGDFECIGFRCIASCSLAGDCDPGYRCDEGRCVESCETEDDCTIGTCAELGGGRRGKACALLDLPQCGDHFHCGGNVCVEGTCRRWCGADNYCPEGELCDMSSLDRNFCAEDPDYEPPPPPQNCAEAPVPNSWCAQEHDNTYRCDQATATCQPSYAAILVRDVTANCDASVEPTSPGADLVGLRVSEPGGAVADVRLSAYVQGAGEENTHTDWEDVETYDGVNCVEERWLSLGCGGWVLVFAQGSTAVTAGWYVQATEDAFVCDESSPDDALEVLLCPRFPSVQTPEADCTVRPLETDVDSTWEVP